MADKTGVASQVSSTPAYKTEIEKCDVPAERRDSLAAFREKRLLWLSWLQDDEHHAISPVISSLVWNDVSFRTLAKAGTLEPDGCLSNTLIAETLINGHFAIQTLGIRRLLDKRNDVVSLLRVLRDIRESTHLLTRENFVCFDGVPYDWEAAKKKAHEKLAQGAHWGAKTGADAYWPSEVAHQEFDKISGIVANKRTRADQIPASYIESLEKELHDSDAGTIVSWTHKYLAHAADQKSRSLVNNAAIQPTLDKITNVTRVFVRVSDAIQALFLSGQGEVMPVAQFNPFEALAAPAIEKNKLPELQKEWEKLTRERNDFIK